MRIVDYGTITYDKETSLERAKSKIGECAYNLIFNNCEHFSRWCAMGKHESIQVLNAFILTAYTIGTIIAVSKSKRKDT